MKDERRPWPSAPAISKSVISLICFIRCLNIRYSENCILSHIPHVILPCPPREEGGKIDGSMVFRTPVGFKFKVTAASALVNVAEATPK